MEGIVTHWSCAALGRGVVGDVLQLLVDPLQGHLAADVLAELKTSGEGLAEPPAFFRFLFWKRSKEE